MIRTMSRIAAMSACVVAGGVSLAAAGEIKSVTVTAGFEDVKFELTNAITERGLAVDYNGQLGKMLERTGADVGSTKPIYRHAEFFTFCSAKLSRAMMEADPLNAAFCPYVMFIFESADAPGKVTVGYRPPHKTGKSASDAALAEIDRMLDGIMRAAVK